MNLPSSAGIRLALLVLMKKQLKLFEEKKFKSRKTIRAIGMRAPNHVVMKAKEATLRLHSIQVKKIIHETQHRYAIRIHALAIMSNHIHFLLIAQDRESFSNALRFIAGQIARKISTGKFWLKRCWSRVVKWGRDFAGVKSYIEMNPVKAGIAPTPEHFLTNGVIILNTS
jgi:REP element-mobilizing transposase RayT